jgi:hypothetical protein
MVGKTSEFQRGENFEGYVGSSCVSERAFNRLVHKSRSHVEKRSGGDIALLYCQSVFSRV